eukprot:TRINITY_DN824_c0_g1_i1.p1 TRINITY_DN824_c0_g1~~TRINITY_DN824_c0_g1_i1.p1  ORF type:complete len:149 (-),score=10.09 TRINITY_DN824_c0_g1_i1:57-503(-)
MIMSALSSSKPRRLSSTTSPYGNPKLTMCIHSRLIIFPRMWAVRFFPSKQYTSILPPPSVFSICPYSCSSSLKASSRLVWSSRRFPFFLFLPPLPKFRGIYINFSCSAFYLSERLYTIYTSHLHPYYSPKGVLGFWGCLLYTSDAADE